MRPGIIVVVLAALALTCTREDGQPDPAPQVLVPCDPHAPAGDPLVCPAGSIDAGIDAPHDAMPDATRDAPGD